MLALAAAINFCSHRLFHRLRARNHREALGMSETSYAQLFLP
jgi:hypothetical protein